MIDNIFLADKKRTRQEWGDGAAELVRRIRQMDRDDLNEWATWFSNVIRDLDGEERSHFIKQLKEGDEKLMCSSFERLLNKEKAEGRAEGRAEGKAESVIELLQDIGEPSEALILHIMGQKDLDVLRKWHKAAAKSESIEDFEQAIGD